jgi:hypothetical protein
MSLPAPIAPRSNMNGMPQRLQRRFVHGLPQGRMDMDRPGHILEHSAHLDKCRKLPRQFGDVLPHCLDA